MESYVAGYIGGASGVFLTHPLDTIKTNMQTSGTNIFNAALNVYKRNGLRSFYAGVVPPVFFRGFAFAMNASSYSLCRSYNFSTVASGFIAGALMSPFESPVMLVKTRAQVTKGCTQESIPYYLRQMYSIFQNEGARGLFSALNIRMSLNSISFAVFYAVYDPLREQIGPLAAGAVAIIPSWTSVYPFEVLQSVQMSIPKKTRWSKKFFTSTYVFKKVFGRKGFFSLWQGYSICIIRAVPRYGMTLYISENLKKTFIRRCD